MILLIRQHLVFITWKKLILQEKKSLKKRLLNLIIMIIKDRRILYESKFIF